MERTSATCLRKNWNNHFIEVKGTNFVSTTTPLIAKHVKFHECVRLEGDAPVTGDTRTLTGLPGVTITVNCQTELKDGGNTITVNDLQGN